PGLCFGSRYPTSEFAVYADWPRSRTFLPDNLHDIAGMLVFDIWVANIDFRQILFTKSQDTPYQMFMYDNGAAFWGTNWKFVNYPRLALHPCEGLYKWIDGIDCFEPWLSKIERMDEVTIQAAAIGIPLFWYQHEREQLIALLRGLFCRKTEVRSL